MAEGMTKYPGKRVFRPNLPRLSPLEAWLKADKTLHERTKKLAIDLLKNTTGPMVGVFASARDAQQAPELHSKYGEAARQLGEELGKAGCSMVTGGCPGIVDEAQAAFIKHRAENTQLSLGVRIDALSFDEPANPNLDISFPAAVFGSRLEIMQYLTETAIIFPGGLGTGLELSTFLQYAQAGQTHRRAPVIFFGSDFWAPQFAQIENMSDMGTVSIERQELDHVYVVDSVEQAIKIIFQYHGNGDRRQGRLEQIAK